MSEPAPTSTSEKSYTNGPFRVSESTVPINGQDWLKLRISLSQEAMIPIVDASRFREAQLEGERVVLGMLNERVNTAIDEIIESEGDK